jgi:hypothetical protein
MSLLNQFLKALNQNRNLQTGFYPVEGNRVFSPVNRGHGRRFGHNLNQFVNGFRAPSRRVMMIAHRA